MKALLIASLCAILFSCKNMPTKGGDVDTLYISTNGIGEQITGKIAHVPGKSERYYDFLSGEYVGTSSADIKFGAYNGSITLYAAMYGQACGGIQIKYGETAPLFNYKEFMTMPTSSPFGCWVLCSDNVHFCSLDFDTLLAGGDQENDTLLFSYTLNLEPNETRF